jgi:phosphate transport system substrate-binding protein
MEKRETMPESSPPTNAAGEAETIASKPTKPSSGSRVESFDFLAPPAGADGLGWLAHYRVVKLLGAGGMGMVFCAEDIHLQRLVALKVLRPELAKESVLRERFLREARAMAAIKSDYIVTVHQVDQASDLPFLAMELLEGQSLEDWLGQGQRPDLATAVRIGREIAWGLAAAHERGLIHRDIKPANVFLEAPTGRVKIVDFGLARPAQQSSGMTEAGTILGTPAYMAPEQADGSEISERSDLFSLGCVLYRLLAHEKPFAGKSTMAVLKAVALTEPKPLSEVNPLVPRALADLVKRLLAKNPADRPATAGEVATALEAIAQDPRSASAAASPRSTVRPSGKPRIPVAGAIVLVSLLLATAVLGTYLLRRTGSASNQAGLGAGAPGGVSTGDTLPRLTQPSSTTTKKDLADTASAPSQTLNGGGSTFIYPLIEKWGSVYRKEKGVKINYVPVGSVGGIQQLTSQTLDFCCTDAPLTAEQLKQAQDSGGDVLHVPLALGGIVPAYNLPGLDKPLRFSGAVLADIFLGEIRKWNDPALQELNPGVALPDQEIVVIHRADGSGSTYIFTDFLSKASKDWRSKIGAHALVKWPVGVGVKGNEGMVEVLLKKPGAIAYVELLYALRSKLVFGAVKNKDGYYLQGSLETVTAAAAGVMADVPADLRLSLTYAPGKDAYPICGCTWAVIYAKQADGKAQRLVEFLRWATQEGQEYNTDLFYARVPKALGERVEQRLKEVKVGD